MLVGCLTSQQQASVSQGRICSDNFTCCHTEIEAADQTFHLTQSHYTDTRPTSPSADPITPGAWQGSHWSANFEVTGMTRPRKNPGASGIRTRDARRKQRHLGDMLDNLQCVSPSTAPSSLTFPFLSFSFLFPLLPYLRLVLTPQPGKKCGTR